MKKWGVWGVLGVFALGLGIVSVIRSRYADDDGVSVLHDISTRAAAHRATRADEGRRLPDIRFKDGTGAARSLSAYSGRYVLLNVWATWCLPCRKEMRSLDALQRALGSPTFEVVALSIDRDGVPAVRKFYEALGLQALRIYIDPSSEAISALGVVGIPTTLFVDPAGKELWRISGAVAWDHVDVIARLKHDMEASQ